MNNRITLLNMLSSLILQICTILSGFIIPRIILTYFGSNVNGLVCSLNQFLSYITIIEGGVTGVITANLYGPLSNNDSDKLNSVVVAAHAFFRKIGIIFIGYSFVLAMFYPFFVGLDFLYVFFLTIILSMNLLVQYMFSLTLKVLLNADKKVYIVSFTQTLVTILNIILAYFSVIIYPSIHLLKLFTGLLFLIQPVVYNYYIKKNYKIHWHVKPDVALIKERWNGFAINIAYFIHSSTGITILTLFSDLATVSVYSTYILVTNGMNSIINSLCTSLNPVLGLAYARKDMNELNLKLDIYEYIIFFLVSFMYSVAGLLIAPFVMIYTHGIIDANYYQPMFGAIIVLSEAFYLVKSPHLNLAYSANKFKEITIPAFIEAAINICISTILVRQVGLLGIGVGALIAMIYRMMFHVYYTKAIVIGRGQFIFYRKLSLFMLSSCLGIVICNYLFPLYDFTIYNWLYHAVVYSIIFISLNLFTSFIFFRGELLFFFKYLKHN